MINLAVIPDLNNLWIFTSLRWSNINNLTFSGILLNQHLGLDTKIILLCPLAGKLCMPNLAAIFDFNDLVI